MEVWVGFEALLRFTSLTDSGKHFQPRLHADILYLPVAQAQHQTEFEPSPQAHGYVHPLAPKGGWDDFRPGEGLKTKPCPALLCSACSQFCQWFAVSSWAITVARHVPCHIGWLIQVSSLTSLTNEPNWSHTSAVDETCFESWSASIAPSAHSILSNMIKSLFPTFASTARVKGDWTGLGAWKTKVLQVKHKEFKSGVRGNYSLLYEISAFQNEGTASLWNILGLSFSPLLQSLWATLEE